MIFFPLKLIVQEWTDVNDTCKLTLEFNLFKDFVAVSSVALLIHHIFETYVSVRFQNGPTNNVVARSSTTFNFYVRKMSEVFPNGYGLYKIKNAFLKRSNTISQ